MNRRDIEYNVAKYFGIGGNIIHTNITCLNLREAGKSDILIIDRKKRCEEVKIIMEIDTLRKEYSKNFYIWDERVYRTYYAFPKSLYINCTKNIDIIIPENFGLLLVDNENVCKGRDLKVTRHRLGDYNKNCRNLTEKELIKVCIEGNKARWRYEDLVNGVNKYRKLNIML